MTIGVDTILAGMQPLIPFGKGSQTTEGAGTIHSLWRVGGNPGAGAIPPAFNTSGYVPTRATVGAFPIANAPSGESRFARADIWGGTIGQAIFCDRLWACSGFVTNSTSLQTVTNQTDAGGGRYASFEGVEMFLEVYTAPGATGATWTITYTNQANTSGRTATYTHPANAESVGQMMPVALQAGDTGVRSVQSLQCSVSSGTAGDIGITLLRRIAIIPIRLEGQDRDGFELGLQEIKPDACLFFQIFCSAGTTGIIGGSFQYTFVTP